MPTDADNPDLIEAVTAALEDCQKIQAIKIYRDATGAGLKESKEFVEALIPRLIEKDPQRFAKLAAGGGGCGGVVLLAAGLSGLVAALLVLVG